MRNDGNDNTKNGKKNMREKEAPSKYEPHLYICTNSHRKFKQNAKIGVNSQQFHYLVSDSRKVYFNKNASAE